jgi:serine/threonine protein kinase
MTDRVAGGTFGAYEILEELGHGGMGKVYRARHITLDRIVALKMLAAQLSSDQAFVQRFLREARSAARLNHPNIVQIYDFGQVGAVYYLAMEFVEGHSVGAWLRTQGRFSERDGVNIVRYVCIALGVAHAQGMVHRDVKPDNMMLSLKGEVKLVDLGLAKNVTEDAALTQTGHSMGTPHYISPEQIKGLKDIDGRADIYSLGASLYHLVTDHTPFSGGSGPVIMTRHLMEPLPDPRKHEPSLSEGLVRVIRKMMVKDREDRYQSIDAVDQDLWRLQRGEAPALDEDATEAMRTPVPPTTPVARTTPTVTPSKPRTPEPATTPIPPSWDSGVLKSIEDDLARSIGPMARVLVRQVTRQAGTLNHLCHRLAEQIPSGEERRTFLKKCLATAPGGPSQNAATPPTNVSVGAHEAEGAPGAVPIVRRAFDEKLLKTVEHELALHIGPVARILVRRAAKDAVTLPDLAARLAENIPDDDARRAFEDAVRRLG